MTSFQAGNQVKATTKLPFIPDLSVALGLRADTIGVPCDVTVMSLRCDSQTTSPGPAVGAGPQLRFSPGPGRVKASDEFMSDVAMCYGAISAMAYLKRAQIILAW